MEQKLQEIQETYRNSCNVYSLLKLGNNKNRIEFQCLDS